MRSREHGLRVSDRLGWRFSTNADVMSFGYNYDEPVNSVGIGHPGARQGAAAGPRRRRPHRSAPPPRPARPGGAGRGDRPERHGGSDADAAGERRQAGAAAARHPGSGGIAGLLANARRDAESLVAGAYKGPVHHSHAFLAVGHDGAAGRLMFEHDSLAVHWPRASDEPIFTHISAMLRTGVAANNGTYVPNPVSSRTARRRPDDRPSARRLQHGPRPHDRRRRPQVPGLRR